MTDLLENLDTFFNPKKVVVCGVSPQLTNFGKTIVQNLLEFGFDGEIFSVGTKGGVIFGQRIYQSIEQIESRIDLAVILTPARTVPSLLEQCGRKGIKNVIIESGGFSEMGGEGISLQARCLAAAKEHGIRFIGPNCLGAINVESGLCVPFSRVNRDLLKGSVSILAQSGGVGLGYLRFLDEERIGVNKFVSLGNKVDINENELLEYLIHDRHTKIILMYLEAFTDGRRFVEIASKCDKPILIHKSNRFEASAQIAHSHTAALFANDELVDYALEQAGCVRVNAMSDAIDYIKILSLPPLRGTRLAVVTRSGGHAVNAADACAHFGFCLPPLPRDFLEKIETRLKANVIRLQNPLDLGDLFDLTFYESIVEETLRLDNVDGVLLGHGYRAGFEKGDSRNFIKKVGELVIKYQKPVAVVVFTEAVEIDYLKSNCNIPIFTGLENAARALKLSYSLASIKEKAPASEPLVEINPEKAENILKKAAGQDHLLLHESLRLIENFGFSLPPCSLARSSDQAVHAWQELNRPVVMKINSPHVSHKTDQGLVSLNLNSEKDITNTFEDFNEKAGSQDIEVLIQPMVGPGSEVIMGGRQDEVFGPVILFGLGGIFVEAIGDVVWRLAPLNRSEARAMIDQIRGRKILDGVRGQPPFKMNELEDLLIGLSQMLADYPIIREIDINPIRQVGDQPRLQALDARVVIECSL
ncbi:MAG: acetate--CoA ligase family protein [Thermodesulfobacteriota bacterium]|nr:acetate--CoA ligase family protein [Thermodesulfobacteriota bacterium]